MARALLIAVLGAAALIDGPVTVTGRIVAEESGAPIVNARVRVTTSTGTALAVTDTDGRFRLDVSAAAFHAVAIKSGYVRREVDVRDPAAPLILRLVRTAVITGRVVDRTGEPVARAIVLAESPPSSRSAGRPVVRTETDDRGEFRLAGLPPEPTVVAVVTLSMASEQVTLPNGATVSSPRQTKTYFPRGEDAAAAEVIRLAPAEAHEGVDFVLAPDQVGLSAIRFTDRVTQSAVPAGATGAIRGRVTSADGRALSGAEVQLLNSAAPVPLRGMRTDADGRFEFIGLPAGQVRIVVSKIGYEPAHAGDAFLPSIVEMGAVRTIDVHDGETIARVDLELRRMATIAGLVVDDLGAPVQGATVQLLKVRFERGRRRLAATGAAQSDDRGAYRIFSIPQGQYIVAATVGGVAAADLPGYGRTYYPGTIDPRSAQFVSVAASQDLVGVDIPLTPVRTARVAGSILGRDGEPTMGGTLQLRPNAAAGEIAAIPIGANVKPDGTFEFPNVPPGSYLIYADKGRRRVSAEADFATMAVAVNGDDVTGLTIVMAPGSTIAGRISFDTADRDHLPPFKSIEVAAVPLDPDLAPSSIATPDIGADGSFVMEGITGTRRVLPTRLPAGWTLKEVRVNGIDATDRPLAFGRREQSLSDVEIVLTDRVGEIDGAAVDADGRAVPGAFVVIMPMDRDLRYGGSRFLRRAVPAADGGFRVAGLPAGTYYVTAVRSAAVDGEDAWQDPSFLETLAPAATSVTVREGEAQTLALRVPSR